MTTNQTNNWLTRLAPALLVLLFSACSSVEQESDIQTPTTDIGTAISVDETTLTASPPPTSPERLIADPPSNWERIYQINSEATRLSDFVPAGENAANWTTKLSFESYSAATLNIDPIELLISEANEDQRKCNYVQHFNIFSGYENNYETSVRLFLCGENEFAAKGEIKLVKAIRGTDNIYSIRLTRRTEPFKLGESTFTDEEMQRWTGYLNRVKLCDDSETHPCTKTSNQPPVGTTARTPGTSE